MSRFSFEIDPGFVAQNRFGSDPEKKSAPILAFFSWTMLAAISLATGAAAVVLFA